MAAYRVLVVDGDWKMRKLIRTNLEAQGLQVVEACDGQACLGALRDQPYDLVLLGIALPDGNGWNVIRRLRRGAADPGVPIVVVLPEPADRRLLRRFGRLSQLLTPFSAPALLECVRQALGQQSP